MLLLLCMYRYQAIEAGWDVDSVLKVCLSRHSVSLSTQHPLSPALSSSVMRSHTAAGDISGAACCTGWSSLFPAAAALGCGGCSGVALWEVNRPACRRSALLKPRKRPNIRLRNWSRGAVIRHMKRQLRFKMPSQGQGDHAAGGALMSVGCKRLQQQLAFRRQDNLLLKI